jgi:hypothetical protein
VERHRNASCETARELIEAAWFNFQGPLRRRGALRSVRMLAARPDDPWNAKAKHRAKPRGS